MASKEAGGYCRVANRLAIHHRSHQLSRPIHSREIRRHSNRDGTSLIAQSGHRCRVHGEQPQSLLQRRAGERHKISQRAVQREHTAGQNAVGCSSAVGNLHGKASQPVFAVGHSRGAYRVGHQDGPLQPLGPPPQLHHLRRNMDAIADYLGIKLIVGQHRPQNPRLAMIQRSHGVERMRCARGSGIDRRAGLGGGSVRVSQRNLNSSRCSVCSQLDCSRQLGRKRHQPYAALSRLKQSIKGGDVGRQQVFRRLRAAPCVGKKRAFQMNSDSPRPALNSRPRHELCQPGERAQRRIQRRGHRSGQKAARAVLGEKAAHGVERRSRGLHHVVALGSMKVHVKKCRPKRRAGKIDNPRPAGRFLSGAR